MNVAAEQTQTIEGIGPQTAALLAAAGIQTVSDLLTQSPDFIHALTSSVASYEEVRAWRAAALLLQVDGMTAQWAEALVAHEVDEFDRLLELDLARLQAIFETAVGDGVIDTAPSADELFSMVRDAAAVHHGGKAQGHVVDTSGEPVPGATVRIGFSETITNESGFWQILKLDAGKPQLVTVFADGYADSATTGITVYTDDWTTATHETELQAGTSEAVVLDEFDGDELPLLTSYVPDVQRFDEAELRDGEVLVVHQLYKRSPHARLVSVFRGFSRGQLLVRAYKVALENLPGTVEPGAGYAFRNGQFDSARIGAYGSSLVRERRRRFKAIEHQVNDADGGLVDKLALYFGPARRDA